MECATQPDGLRVIAPDGREVLSQVLSYDPKAHRLRFLFAATVPSLGCAVYDIRLGLHTPDEQRPLPRDSEQPGRCGAGV